MLLQELKLLRETDREPLGTALQNLGVNLHGGDRGRAADDDVDGDLTPTVRKYILSPNKLEAGDAAGLERDIGDSSKFGKDKAERYATAFKGLRNVTKIVNNLEAQFISAATRVPGVEDVAKSAPGKPRSADAWFNNLRELGHALERDYVAGPINIPNAMSNNSEKLEKSVMQRAQAQTYVGEQLNKLKAAMADGTIPKDQLAKEVELMFAVLHRIRANVLTANEYLEKQIEANAPAKKP